MITYNYVTCIEDQTVKQFLSQYKLLSDFTSQDFIDFKGDTGSTNFERINRKCSLSQQDSNNNSSADDIEIVSGTSLLLENSKIKREILRAIEPDQFTLGDFKPFIVDAFNKIITDKNYVSELNKSDDGRALGRVVSNEFTVLMWIRSLSPYGQIQGAWINVSSFVESVTINSTGAGGTFSLSMVPVTCTPSALNGWDFKSRVQGFNDDVLIEESILKSNNVTGDYNRNDFLFHTAVQHNDLVLIKMERLALESKRLLLDIDPSSLDITGVDKVYDMIGLVDNTTIATTPGNVNVIVQGRDLTKILIDDGSVFFPEQFAQDIFSSDGVLSQRLQIEKDLHAIAFGSYQPKAIDTILKFIFDKYSNVGYVPDSALSVYGNRVNKDKYPLLSSNQITSPSTYENVQTGVSGIDQGAKLTFDKVQSSKVLLSPISQSILNQARRGVWQIIELVIDKQVAKRVLIDNNINHDQGSIINTINKICQMPLVQFYTDTYGDKFYLIVRKPPFDQQGYLGMVYDTTTTVAESLVPESVSNLGANLPTATVNASRQDLVIEIDDSSVIGEPTLTYHDEVYSWYRLIPRGTGLNDQTLFTLTPIITLDLYGEVFGSRAFSLEYNYCPSEFVIDSDVKQPLDYLENQVFKDLQFIIQSYAYLPFTRRGTIVLDGDRRIKKGMFIRYKPTSEIFYVDSVANTRTLSNQNNVRTTTLQVTRGMREKYLVQQPVLINGKVEKVSYFNIVNTELPDNASINNKDFLRTWEENENIFNFFLSRRQWVD